MTAPASRLGKRRASIGVSLAEETLKFTAGSTSSNPHTLLVRANPHDGPWIPFGPDQI